MCRWSSTYAYFARHLHHCCQQPVLIHNDGIKPVCPNFQLRPSDSVSLFGLAQTDKPHLRAKHIKERKNTRKREGDHVQESCLCPSKRQTNHVLVLQHGAYCGRQTRRLCSLFSLGADSFGYTRCPCTDLLPHSFPKPTVTHAHH